MIFQRRARPRGQGIVRASSTCVCLLAAHVLALGQSPTANRLADEKHAEVVRLGEAIVEDTTSHPLSRSYVGNSLNCTSCHLNNGRHARAGTFLGTATAYPAWSPRENRVITLEDRVLNCFMRSCNGLRPPLGSEVSLAVTTYITSLSQGLPMQMNTALAVGPGAIKPISVQADHADVKRGAGLYATRCAECHQNDGQGDESNPPVWGDRSYNDGAGLSSVEKLAAWLKVAMPLDQANLTDQQALDLAGYVNSQPRPHFDLPNHLPVREKLGEFNASHPK